MHIVFWHMGKHGFSLTGWGIVAIITLLTFIYGWPFARRSRR